MKKLIFLGACLVGLASQPVLAQTSGPDVAVVSFYYGGNKLYATIARGKSEPETQETKGDVVEHTKFQQQVIATLYQEGYRLKSTFSPGTYNQSTLIFTKGE